MTSLSWRFASAKNISQRHNGENRKQEHWKLQRSRLKALVGLA